MPTSSPAEAARPVGPVLLTGAAGRLGRVLAPALAGLGWELRLTDRAPFPDPLPPGAAFSRAELGDAPAIAALAEGCAAILHFGGISTEAGFEDLLDANLRGTHAVFAAALAAGARVVFASSNHVAGFWPRSERLSGASGFRPDGLYGASKAYGELLARLYWDKHGVANVSLRIGSCFARPRKDRELATWLSHGDLVRLAVRAVLAADAGCAVVWGVSANSRAWWGEDDRDRIGWQPRDSADDFAGAALQPEPDDDFAAIYQGGAMCSRDSRRAGTLPAQPAGTSS